MGLPGAAFRWSPVLLLTALIVLPDAANSMQQPEPSQLTAIARRLSGELGVERDIRVVVASKHERMVSVERNREHQDTFTLTFDRNFLTALNQEEITAAIAHEIGHIWIFCHFPYLHTEVLANEIALEMVKRKDLESLYRKLRDHIGTHETVEEFLESNLPAMSPPVGIAQSLRQTAPY